MRSLILLFAAAVVPASFAAPVSNSDAAFTAELAAAVRTVRAAVAKKAKVQVSAEQKAPPSSPALKACDAAAGKQHERSGVTLMLLTDTAAYYYAEDCDICASLDVCDLKTGEVGNVISAHSVRCEDLAPYRKGKVVYDSCR